MLVLTAVHAYQRTLGSHVKYVSVVIIDWPDLGGLGVWIKLTNHLIFSFETFQRLANQIVSTVGFVKEQNVNVLQVILVNIVKLVSEHLESLD